MPFPSLVFLLLVLPAVLIGLALAERWGGRARVAYLAAVSLAFYAWWDARFVPVLVLSVFVNWLAGRAFAKGGGRAPAAAAIALNVALLGLFKYLDFFAGLVGALTGREPEPFGLALPIGISFFTFQHVAYLVDLTRDRAAPVGLVRYFLFVAFFPRVLAGPLVRPSEVMREFDRPSFGQADTEERLARGLLLLTLGLAKKVFLGDALAPHVDAVHALMAAGQAPTIAQAWTATLGYALQLYFDFSGYSDMAVAIALLLGVRLPQNFDTPYRATSIQDFWRRWHITLSSFLRDYVYIPLGGSRAGVPRQVLALVLTMTLGGLWHGAGLTFVAWGLAHGIALSLHVLWRRAGLSMPAPAGLALTLAFVVLAWVPFRAASFADVSAIYGALLGFAPLGSGGPWALIAVAAALATLGPRAQDLADCLPPLRWVAAGATGLFVAVLLRVGNDGNQSFIYQGF